MKNHFRLLLYLATGAILLRRLSRVSPAKKTWKSLGTCWEVGLGPVLLIDLVLPPGKHLKRKT